MHDQSGKLFRLLEDVLDGPAPVDGLQKKQDLDCLVDQFGRVLPKAEILIWEDLFALVGFLFRAVEILEPRPGAQDFFAASSVTIGC